MDELNYKVYIKTDGTDIVAVNSSAFLPDTTDWIEIDSGQGDKYHHAQGNYFPLPIVTDNGIYRYKYVNGEVVEKTAEEIATEEANLPPPEPTREDLLEQALLEMTTLMAEQELKQAENEQAILELSMLLGGIENV